MSFNIPKGNAKAEYVKQRFTGIAERYDLFNDIVTQGMHRYWKRFLIKKAQLDADSRVLDICCGTGDITGLLNRRIGSGSQVIGLDFSEGMIEVGARRKNNKGVLFVRGDASVLPVRSESLDAVTVGYGLRNLVNIESCLAEVFRVLKKGGRFLSLDMGKVKIPIAREVFAFYFFKIVPRIGRLIYPDEDLFDYFPESSVNFPSQEKLAEMIGMQGFTRVRYFNFYLGSTAVHYAEKPT